MDENIKIDNAIEKKFRSITLETKIISYILQKDHKISFFVDESTFTIEAYQLFLKIVRKNKLEYPKSILWKEVKKEVLQEEDRDIIKSFVLKVYSADLKNITPKNIEKLCIQLFELKNSRKLMSGISEVISSIPNFNLNKAQFKLRNVLLNTDIKSRETIDYVNDFEKRRDHLKEVARDPKTFAGIPTGIREFDKLSGGLMRTEFGVIVMNTGGGKSITLGNIGTHSYYKGYNVVIATFEMGTQSYAYRLDSRNCRIPYSKFRKAELDIFEYERMEQKISQYKERKSNFLKIAPFRRGSTVGDIENELYKIQDETGQSIDLVLVDYLNLISVKSHGKSGNKSWENQTDAAWEIKELSQNFNNGSGLGIWTANQLTDEGAKAKKITTSHMKYARGISEVAPIIIALSQTEEAKIQDFIELWIIKCRDFAKQDSPILLYPNFQYMLIDDPSRRIDIEGSKKHGRLTR